MPAALARRIAAALVLAAASAAGAGGAAAQTVAPKPAGAPEDLPRGSGFDFYVLALSWSPSYCLGAGRRENRQCDPHADHHFIVHGLWPQFEDGYPEYCPSRQPERVPEQVGRAILDLAPSMGLIGHMWRKHGTCTRLDRRDYFRLVRAARERVRIPSEFQEVDGEQRTSAAGTEAAFIAANPGMAAEGIAAVCNGGRLQEVRICLTHELAFRPCRQVDRAGCTAASLALPPPL